MKLAAGADFDQLHTKGGSVMSMGDGGVGGGGFFGRMAPSGSYGAWPGCGCSSLFIIVAGIILVMGGCLKMLGQ